jgi:hypothetical protein
MTLKRPALVLTLIVLSSVQTAAQAKATWCQNSNSLKEKSGNAHEDKSDWVRLPANAFRLVAQQQQAAARARLRNASAVLLDAATARQFIAPGGDLPDGKYVSLVRAAGAGYSDRADPRQLDFIKNSLAISFSKESSEIRVLNFHLGSTDGDGDLALLVGTDQPVALQGVVCIGAL